MTASRFENPDAAYEAFAAAQHGLDAEASALFNARVALLLANHIGDLSVLREALELARAALPFHRPHGSSN
ncbi:MAG TPA: DUF2783 domain-containing protein [Xanthobacteraceae bacterium]|nr:DUF2783 domain-containing protein [Xanthobacteraceae bacterium]